MIIFDTETTGFLRAFDAKIELQPHMTEICCVRVDKEFNMIGEFESLVKPGIPIPEATIKINGIDDAMVADAPSFIEIYDELAQLFLGEDILVAHNANFDVGVLWYELARLGFQANFPWPMRHICTIEKTMHIEGKRLNLGKLHKYATGLEFVSGAHRAKNDVYALVRCFHWLVEEGIVEV